MTSATATQDRIIDAAADCIVEHGYASVRMSTVARAAGVSTALLHYHFDTREKLFATVMRRCLGHIGMNESRAQELGRLAPAVRLSTMVAACLPASEELRRDWVLWYELYVQAMHDPELSSLARAVYGDMDAWFADTIVEGQRAGEFRPKLEPLSVARLALGLCDGIGARLVVADDDLGLAQARDLVLAALGCALDAQLPTPRLDLLGYS